MKENELLPLDNVVVGFLLRKAPHFERIPCLRLLSFFLRNYLSPHLERS